MATNRNVLPARWWVMPMAAYEKFQPGHVSKKKLPLHAIFFV
jgi:hypothetical protein